MRRLKENSEFMKRLLQGLTPTGVLALLAARSVEGQSDGPRFVPLSTDQLLQQGEQPIGQFSNAIDQVDRLYLGEKFGVVFAGDQALSNETLSSFQDGSVTVEFLDGTLLTVGPNSEVILDEFVYDTGSSKGKMSLNILSGIVKFVSGDMSSDSYTIETPSGIAAIRGTELVFMVEPDGDVSLGVFSGGVSFSVGGTTLEARADDPTSNLLTFELDGPEGPRVSKKEMGQSFSQVKLVFDQPAAYSTFVAAYKTEQFKEAIIRDCLDGASCEAKVGELVEELAELGVDQYDVLKSLENVKQGLVESGADPKSVKEGLGAVDGVVNDVEKNYEPEVKKPKDDKPPKDGEGAGRVEEELGGRESGQPGPILPPIVPPIIPGGGNQPPSDIQLSGTTVEENSQSLIVGVLSATDDSTSPENMVFEVLPNGVNDDHLAFAIDPTSRALSFTDVQDYEAKPSYVVRIKATDEDGRSKTKDFAIDVIDVDEDPEISVLGPIVVPGDTGPGSATIAPVSLANFVTISDPEGTLPMVTLTGVSGVTLSPATASGLVSGSFDGVTVNQDRTQWSAVSATASLTVHDTGGKSASADIQIAGELVIGPSDLVDVVTTQEKEGPGAFGQKAFVINGQGGDDVVGGALTTSGGVQVSSISGLAQGQGGTAHINLQDGDNTLNLGDNVGKDDGYFQYTDGPDADDLNVGDNFADSGEARLFFEMGGTNSLTAGVKAGEDGIFLYYGGYETDDLSFGDEFAAFGTAEIHLGDDAYNPISPDQNSTSDTAADTLEFRGSVGLSGNVRIYNYNSDDDQLGLPHLNFSHTVTANDDYRITSSTGTTYYDFTLYNVDGTNVLNSFYEAFSNAEPPQ